MYCVCCLSAAACTPCHPQGHQQTCLPTLTWVSLMCKWMVHSHARLTWLQTTGLHAGLHARYVCQLCTDTLSLCLTETLSPLCTHAPAPAPPPGCFTDDQVFDDSHTPPSPTQRRMWRRLGQAPDGAMDSWECARRAHATGYPLFGLTSGEVFSAYGMQCWCVTGRAGPCLRSDPALCCHSLGATLPVVQFGLDGGGRQTLCVDVCVASQLLL
jgi:hypothetical protein